MSANFISRVLGACSLFEKSRYHFFRRWSKFIKVGSIKATSINCLFGNLQRLITSSFLLPCGYLLLPVIVRLVFDRCSIGVRLVFDPNRIQTCINRCPIDTESMPNQCPIDTHSIAEPALLLGGWKDDNL